MRYLIEIRAAEGGEDAKLFVWDLADAYVRKIRIAMAEGVDKCYSTN
jgi:protein subunit release factor A